MLTTFQWVCLISILGATFAGGFYPLFNQGKVRDVSALPSAEAFTTGVFLALATMMMLPSSIHLLHISFPQFDFPLSLMVAVTVFLLFLALEHHINNKRLALPIQDAGLTPPFIPILMTIMIGIPSFFLGTALGVTESDAAILIFVAIMMHKSSAAFGLALKMIRSTMSKTQVWLVFSLFAFATPLGIVVGQEIHQWVGASAMTLVKGIILGLAAGTFLFLSTLHELMQSPLITRCNNRRGFLLMLSGFLITALVRLLMGEAHQIVG